MAPDKILDQLTREQAADDADDHQQPEPGQVQESSLGRRSLAGYADARGVVARVGVLVLLGGARAWSLVEHGLAGLVLDGERIPCPVCREQPLPASHYCLACDAYGRDGREELPGLPIGSAIDPDYPAEPTKYVGKPLTAERARKRRRGKPPA